MKNNSKILLHACCGICSGYPIEHLRELGYEPVVYFFNPNIYPEAEYLKRLDAQKTICKIFDCELIVEEYESKIFKNIALGLEQEPESGKRCKKCFELRLSKTAQKALSLGVENFTTSIVISPHKNFKLISQIGKTISQNCDVNYLDIDFKKKDGFLKSNKIAKELSLYRQNYCGCEYSINQTSKGDARDKHNNEGDSETKTRVH